MCGNKVPGRILEAKISILTYVGKDCLTDQRKVIHLFVCGQLWTEMEMQIRDKCFRSKLQVTPVFCSMEKGRREREKKAAHQNHPAELGIAREYSLGQSAVFMKHTG